MRRTRVAPDGPAPSLTHRGRAMQQDSAVFVGLDTSKMKISVALAEEGRQGEVRFLGDIDHTPETVRRLVTKLAGKYGRLLFHRYTTAHRSPCRRRAERRAPGEPSGRAGSHTSRGGSPARRLPPAPSLQRVAPPCLRRSGCRAAVACRPLSGCRPGAPAERDSDPCSPRRSRADGGAARAWAVWSAGGPVRLASAWTRWDLTGSQAIHPVPLSRFSGTV